MAGVIAMISALIVVGIEMFLRTRGAGHAHSHGQSWEPLLTEEYGHSHGISGMNGTTSPIEMRRKAHRQGRLGDNSRPTDLSLGDIESSEGLIDGASPLAESTLKPNGNKRFHDRDGEDRNDGDSDLDFEELDPAAETSSDVENHTNSSPNVLSPEAEQKRLMIQCMLLEAGILFHSVFIGMAISVATGTPFVVFLVAISFHQSFEGLALGSRIAAINFSKSSPKPWLMVLAYGTTTPLGQAIGLLVQSSYDPHSEAGLLMVGIMNAISSGLLLFAGLVQLLAEDFLSDKSYDVLKGRRRWHAFMAVIGGATLMALVGAWA
jgi:solute carrier family 39 (zinc transporter), member 1/2/3